MRLFYYSLGFFALSALLCFAFIEVKGHAPREVELTVKNFQGRPLKNAIRVYQGPDLKNFRTYNILDHQFKFQVLNIHSYALGAREDIVFGKIRVDDGPIKFGRKKGGFNIARIEAGNKHILPANLIISKIIACIILAAYSAFFFWLLGKAFQSDWTWKKVAINAALFSCALFPILFYAYTFSPALYDYDFPDSLILSSKYGLSGWFSFINYLVLGAGIIIGKFTGLGLKTHMLIQASCVFIGSCFYINLLRASKAPKASIALFLALLWSPSFVLFSLQVSRDFWTTFLPVVAAIGIMLLKFEKSVNYKASIFISLSMAWACLYRPELLLGGLVLVFAMFWVQNLKSALISALLIFGFLTTGLVVNNKIDPKASKIKLVGSLSQPLGAVLTSDSPKISEEEMALLKSYVDTELMKEKHVDHEILPFHLGAVKLEKALRDLPEYLKLNAVIFLKNPLTVLKARLALFAKLIGATGWTSGHPDDHSVNFNLKNKNIVGLVDWKVLNKGPQTLRKMIINAQNSAFAWAFCMLPSLFICLWTLLSYRKNSASALAAALVLSKLPVFFLLAPAAHFKYAWDIYAIGLLLWPLALAERKRFFTPLKQ